MNLKVGDIVLYRLNRGHDAQVLPAVVVAVGDHERLELEVLGVVGTTPERFPTNVPHGRNGLGEPLEGTWCLR